STDGFRVVPDVAAPINPRDPVDPTPPKDVPPLAQHVVAISVVPIDDDGDPDDPDSWHEDVGRLERGRKYQLVVRYRKPFTGAPPDREASFELGDATYRLALRASQDDNEVAISDPFELT